jgi:hypothetical protein
MFTILNDIGVHSHQSTFLDVRIWWLPYMTSSTIALVIPEIMLPSNGIRTLSSSEKNKLFPNRGYISHHATMRAHFSLSLIPRQTPNLSKSPFPCVCMREHAIAQSSHAMLRTLCLSRVSQHVAVDEPFCLARLSASNPNRGACTSSQTRSRIRDNQYCKRLRSSTRIA